MKVSQLEIETLLELTLRIWVGNVYPKKALRPNSPKLYVCMLTHTCTEWEIEQRKF